MQSLQDLLRNWNNNCLRPVWMAVEGESDAPLAYAEYFNILRTIPLPELDSQQLDFLLLCCLVPGSIPLQDINISRLKAECENEQRRRHVMAFPDSHTDKQRSSQGEDPGGRRQKLRGQRPGPSQSPVPPSSPSPCMN
ncbi:hypothetical protein RJZ57_004122 [Blastomyces gilchristii]